MTDFAIKVLTAGKGQTHLFYAGQAGYIIKSASGQLLAVDLYLSECVERLEGHVGFKRLQPKILNPFELEFDAIITTHPHWDHFDVDAVPQMMSSGAKLYASVNCAEDIRRLGMKENNVLYVKPGMHCCCGDFKMNFINCDHGTGAPDAVGVLINVDHTVFCVVGDSCLRLDRTEEYLSMGTIDVLIAPINGAYGNLNEQECAQLSGALQPKLTIPCHYGMFASHGGDPGHFIDVMNTDYKARAYCLMAIGEKLSLS